MTSLVVRSALVSAPSQFPSPVASAEEPLLAAGRTRQAYTWGLIILVMGHGGCSGDTRLSVTSQSMGQECTSPMCASPKEDGTCGCPPGMIDVYEDGSSTCKETMGVTPAMLLPAAHSSKSDATSECQAQVSRPRLLVLSGVVAEPRPGIFATRSSNMRASFGDAPRTEAEIHFVYSGASSTIEPLASGEVRRQIGLRLRARNTCNLLYVMWHIEPSPGIEVSVKTNLGQSTHAECGDRGYRFIQPTWSCAGNPSIQLGVQHSLRAAIRGNELLVTLDGRLCWVGELPPVAFSFDGPAGVRTDNGTFDFTFNSP